MTENRTLDHHGCSEELTTTPRDLNSRIALEEFNKGDVPSSPTGYSFLKMMGTLRKISLQDAAAMIVQNPDRAAHPIFKMDVFKTDEFSTFVQSMKVYFRK